MPYWRAVTPTTTTTATPPEIQGFRSVRLLGAGESSDVFLYVWEKTSTEVAVKVWREPLDRPTRDALARETTAVAAMGTHPHVVPLHAVGVEPGGRSFVVMDYLPGADLEQRRQGGGLGVEQALSATIAVAGAVAAAARRGILHGDVKPANILTTSGGVPQLAGFGQVSSAGREPGSSPSSLPWLPPEMIADPPEPSVWVDVWGLAATCYTLIAGRTPFEVPGGANTPAHLTDRIKHHELAPTGRAGVPESLERVLRKGMAKRRAERYWSASDFAVALQKVQEELGHPVMPLMDVPEPEPDEPEAPVELTSAPEPPPTGTAPDAVAPKATPDTGSATTQVAAVAPVPTPPGPTGPPPPVPPGKDAAAVKEPATETAEEPTCRPAPEQAAPEPAPAEKTPTGSGAAIYTVSFPKPDADAGSKPSPGTSPGAVPAQAAPPAVEQQATQTAPEPAADQVAEDQDTAKTPTVAASVPAPAAEEDLLGYGTDIGRLARLLAAKDTAAPLAVALQAPQGSGRSTFLRRLEARIDGLAGQSAGFVSRVRHVRFNALHRGADQVVAGVIDELRDSLNGDRTTGPRRSEWSLAAERLRAAERRQAELHAAFDGVADDATQGGAGRALRRKGGAALTAAEALGWADREVDARRTVLSQTPAVGVSLEPSAEAGRRSASGTVGSAYDELRDSAQSLVGVGGAERVFVYVDDLDRCDPQRAFAVLQAIEMLTRLDGFVVVTGVDTGWLQRSLLSREPEPATYLERVFQVPFALRPVAGDAAVRYMRSLVGTPALATRAGGLRGAAHEQTGEPGLSDGEAVFVSDLARFCGTPRAVEKLLTLYRMARTAPAASGSPSDYHPLGVLVAIVVGAPAQAPVVLDAVLDVLATGDAGVPLGDILEKAGSAHRCDLPGCETRAAWRRVRAAYAHLCRVQDVPREIGAYAGWVEEVSRYLFAPAHEQPR